MQEPATPGRVVQPDARPLFPCSLRPGRLSLSGAEGWGGRRGVREEQRAEKEEKMKRGEIAKGNEKNFTARFLLLPDPIIRFCISV